MSLVELLVAMVVLAVGIFSAVRIFPVGIRSMNHARNMSLAGRLASAELERLQAATDNLPDGILPEDPNNPAVPLLQLNPDDMRTAGPGEVPSGGSLASWSNVNRVRLIRGETTVIPAPTLLPYTKGDARRYAYSIYNLKFAPIEFSTAAGENPPPGFEWPDNRILVYGDPLPRTDVTGLSDDDRDATLVTMNRQGYAIDYDTGTLYFRPSRWTRKYRVEYNYWNGPQLASFLEIVTVGEDQEAVQLSHANLDYYSDRVARKFEYVSPENGFEHYNPYQFTLLSRYAAFDFAPTIGFNPIGEQRTVRTDLGMRPLRAHIDYEVLDWHIIREERTVPNPGQSVASGYVVSLTLPDIRRVNSMQDSLLAVNARPGEKVTQERYTGLTDTMTGISVVGLDLNDNTLMVDGPPGSGNLEVNHAAGTIKIPQYVRKYTPFGDVIEPSASNPITDIRGHDVRFFYRAVGDWAVQVTRAWANYQRSAPLNGSFENLAYNTFDVELVAPGAGSKHHSYSNDSDQWQAILTFPRIYAGMSVSASFVWRDRDGNQHQVTGRQYKLPTFGAIGTGYPYVAVNIGENLAPSKDSSEEWKNPYFTFVQGPSLLVRTIWRENPRRWEMRRLETYLDRQ